MFVLTEFEKKRLLFKDPLDIISCHNISEVEKCFYRMEEALRKGHYLAGFFSYEAGQALEERTGTPRQAPPKAGQARGKARTRFEFPMVYMGVFEKGRLMGGGGRRGPRPIPSPSTILPPAPIPININVPKEEYFKNIELIRSYIASGDVYQITYCIKYKFDYSGNAFALYEELKRKQPVPYPAYIDAGDFQIASLSPELFLKKNGDFIMTKPMKGTWFRGKGWLDGWTGGWKLHFDPKNRAENIMICDLLRNDLGRIGENVRAPKLYEVAKYKTLFQMTSTVTANIDKDIPLYKLFKAVFPTGSVTGAPKIRAMQIINEIEKEERNIYTGAIGYITPEKDLFFNVPIRTLLLRKGKGEMGVGGGIVWDSTPEGELEECRIKARFIM